MDEKILRLLELIKAYNGGEVSSLLEEEFKAFAEKYMEEKQEQTRSFRETAICLLILSILNNTRAEAKNEIDK